MFRRTMLKAVTVVGVLTVMASSAWAHGPRVVVPASPWVQPRCIHRPHVHVVQPNVVVYRQPAYVLPNYTNGYIQNGYSGAAYGGVGGYSGLPYTSGYYADPYYGVGYGGSGFGFYYSR